MLAVFQHEGVGRAGIEPDVEDVVDLLPASLACSRAEEALARAVGVPGVGALLLEGVGDALVDALVVQDFDRPSPFSWTNTAIGTPQARWREITQSGRLSIMPVMRFSPGGGTHAVSSIAVERAMAQRVARLRRCSLSIAMNHCGVLRKITGFFERQECGYWCFSRPRAMSLPASTSALMTASLASPFSPLSLMTRLPVKPGACFGEGAVLVDGVGDCGSRCRALASVARVRRPDVEVLAAVAGRGVHEAGAGVVGDVIAVKQRHVEIVAADSRSG